MRHSLTPAGRFTRLALRRLLVSALLITMPIVAGAQARIVDIANDTTAPPSLVSHDEPSIAVNPINPQEIAVVAFSNNWGPGVLARVWKSRDGGLTWQPIDQIPEPEAGFSGPADQSIGFDTLGRLYVVAAGLNFGTSTARDYIFRQTSADPDAPLTPGQFYGYDQPMLKIDLASAMLNRMYSPWAFYSSFADTTARSMVTNSNTGGETVTNVDVGDDSSFGNRTTRVAIAPDGKVYAIYKTQEGSVDVRFENAHFYVRRSDDGGATWNAIGGLPGISVHGAGAVVTWFTDNSTSNGFGNAAKGKIGKARSSDAWIAADPVSGDVYAAYCNRDASTFGQIYVARSTTEGTGWNTPVRVTNGTHHSAYPEIAVAANGTIGVLYIDYDDSGAATTFSHHFSRSFDHGATWHDEVLQTMNPAAFTNALSVRLWSDWENLTAVGHTFYGAFTGQSIGRAVPQLDPIFFRETSVQPADDFYVRDWTTDATHRDLGEEPSTNPSFFSTSDVWNRRDNTVGPLTNDQPPEQRDPREASAGSNFAFVRVFRNSAGSPADVQARFMFADFGLGSNFVSIGSGIPATVSFSAIETEKHLTDGRGFEWQLPVTHSDHVCMAVEITGPNDPFMPLTLIGRAPGWPTTDLSVLNDNNKAQRNMAVYYGSSEFQMMYYAVVHNAATERRDMLLRTEAGAAAARELKDAAIEVLGARTEKLPFKSGETITLPAMEPGENRMVRVSFTLPRNTQSGPLPLSFSEIVNRREVNGFSIAAQTAPVSRIFVSNLEFERAVFSRMAEGFNVNEAREVAKLAQNDLQSIGTSGSVCISDILCSQADLIEKSVKALVKSQPTLVALSPVETLKAFHAAVQGGDPYAITAAQANLLHTLDAYMTLRQLAQGNTADILQNVTWQRDLYSRIAQLRGLPATPALIQRSNNFIAQYRAGNVSNNEYAAFVAASITSFQEAATALRPASLGLERDIVAMQSNSISLTALQKSHWDFLLKLSHLE